MATDDPAPPKREQLDKLNALTADQVIGLMARMNTLEHAFLMLVTEQDESTVQTMRDTLNELADSLQARTTDQGSLRTGKAYRDLHTQLTYLIRETGEVS